ncbi:ankyrin repeat and SAM domain-containing protein 6-like [Anneissia japonica]|uniref:ankyrin repeat and SAM domain-containing protein 6-like n=1 Tax=Anneissia japonica TaxID=1529436 RepID=UPI0014259040|nr:ankyrin repeat and SAM domain-containing protein 6-like [Anneissia japonica]
MIEYNVDLHKQLCTAAEQGDLVTVQTLLQQNDIDIDCVQEEAVFTPLQLAAANGHEDVVRLLIMRGAALDRQNFYGWTALMQAASYGHDKVVALLLKNKADFKAKNKLGASALTVAARHGHTAVVKRLLDCPAIDINDGTRGINESFYSKGIGATPLMVASQFGHDAVMRALLDRGSNPKHKNETTGWNALMFAALNGHMTSAQILVDRGCDPNETNYIDKTAYEIAVCAGKREAAGYLDRKTTRRPKIVPTTSKPKIIEAAETGDLKLMEKILDDDPAQVDTVSPEGATSLMIAAMLGRIDIADMLLKRGADINKQDSKNGWTALMQATFYRHTTFVKFLLSGNADASLKALDGCTALDLVFCLADSDPDLTRMLASAAMPVQGSSTSRPPKNSTGSGTWLTKSGKPLPDEKPKGGLKAWWNRLSNRFQNLKLSRTLMSGMTTTKLTPFHDENGPTDTADSIDKEKVYGGMQRDGKKKRKTSEQKDDLLLKSILSNDSGLSSTNQSMQSLSILSPMSTFQNDKLLPVVPPFHPPPTFDPNDRSKRPMNASRTSLSMLANGKNTGPRQPHMKSKGLFIRPHNKSISPSNSNNFSVTTSPNSSGGASSISKVNKPYRLSAHDNKVTGESTPKHGHESSVLKAYPDIAFLPQSAFKISPKSQVSFNEPSSPVSPTSQTSGFNNSSASSTISGSVTPSKQRPLSGTSLGGSTTPTLTPSPSPSPKGRPGSNGSSTSQASSTHQPKNSSSSGVSEDDELSALLRKLSLEKYAPIFEEQEVDMEAFLSLDKSDLTELGIKQSEPQSRILLAINELNSGRHRDFKA